MEDCFLPAHLSVHHFDLLLASYAQTVPSKLEDLEKLRLQTVPETLEQRRKSGRAYLSKNDTVALLEWKLSHGTFRPSLRSLVASNTAHQVETTSQQAFALLPPDYAADLSKPLDLTPMISKLSTLRGIGPATASLLLNTHSPSEIPFFSDELYRWLRFSDPTDVKGPGKGTKGWERRIGYTAKEYMELVRRMCTFRDRLRTLGRDAGATDIECVAYVLGKTGGKDIPLETGSTEKPDVSTSVAANENEGFEALARGVMAAIDKEHALSVEQRADKEEEEDDNAGEMRRKRRRKA